MIKNHMFSKVGIVGYGTYIPQNRIKSGGNFQSVADTDEDALTMAVESSYLALKMAKIDPVKIGACFVGSESSPYAVKPIGSILADILGIDHNYFCASIEFACKGGTAALGIVAAMIEAGMIDYGLAVGTDRAQASSEDVLSSTVGSGSAAFILGKKISEWKAKINYTTSFTSDTPDFWRRSKIDNPTHMGRFTGANGYFKHTAACAQKVFTDTKTSATDYDWAVFHSPVEKYPREITTQLGFDSEKIKHSLLFKEIGNTYSASSLISLANVLRHAKKNDKIFMVSYGSGAGSDGFTLNKI